MKIAIIGAGMAGLSCALKLKSAGNDLSVFDKGRGPGGRLSTRRMNTPLGEVRWDHGAQFFTARDNAFQRVVEGWINAGIVAQWHGQFLDLGPGAASGETQSDPRYVGVPGMNEVIRHMSRGFDVQWARRVSEIAGNPGSWSLTFEDGANEGPFEAVVIAVPAEQAADLLSAHTSSLTTEAQQAVSAPCWAVMIAYDSPLDAGFDGARITGGPLSWIARNASKPGRGASEAWVLHASPDWSREHIDEQPEEVAAKLIRNFRAMSGAPAPVVSTAHRWLYAMVESPPNVSSGWDRHTQIGVCGDWRIAPRIEAAWQSGARLADEILHSS